MQASTVQKPARPPDGRCPWASLARVECPQAVGVHPEGADVGLDSYFRFGRLRVRQPWRKRYRPPCDVLRAPREWRRKRQVVTGRRSTHLRSVSLRSARTQAHYPGRRVRRRGRLSPWRILRHLAAMLRFPGGRIRLSRGRFSTGTRQRRKHGGCVVGQRGCGLGRRGGPVRDGDHARCSRYWRGLYGRSLVCSPLLCGGRGRVGRRDRLA